MVSAIFGLEAVEGTLIAALVAACVAVFANWRSHRSARMDRRRTLYGEAYQAVLEWCEAVWRVRRRPADGSGDDALVQHFHELQERLAYYDGWLALESTLLAKAFRTFTYGVLDECEPLIRTGWKRDGRKPQDPRPDGEADPSIDALKEQFLTDVRDHQSKAPWRRLRFWWRYRRANPARAASPPSDAMEKQEETEETREP